MKLDIFDIRVRIRGRKRESLNAGLNVLFFVSKDDNIRILVVVMGGDFFLLNDGDRFVLMYLYYFVRVFF